jgi:serine/threonine protein kinase
MAPEQARGDQLGPPADIYALGAILYELLTGRHPYDGLAMKAIFDALKAGTPPVAPHTVQPRTPKALEAICRKAMSAAPDDRYATPTQLAKDIEHWLADEPVTCYGEPWPVRAGRWSRKHRTLVMSGVVGLGGAIVLLVVSLILVDQNRRQIAFEKEQTEQQRIAAVAARDRGSQIVEDVFGDESFESLRRQPGGADTRPEALRVERAALLPGVHHRFTTG